MTDEVELPKTLLVVLALHALGGESDLETIAVQAHKMFPGQFCWRRYPDLPDKDAVRVHLSEAKKSTFGRLVADTDLRNVRRGEAGRIKRFALTRQGVAKAQELSLLLENVTVTATKNPIDHKRIVEPILSSSAFRRFTAGTPLKDVGREEFLLAFKLFADASPFLINGRLARALSAIDQGPLPDREKQTLHQFIESGRNAFKF